MTKRILSLALAALLCLALFAGCQSTSPSSNSGAGGGEDTPPAGPVTIRVRAMFGGSDANKQNYDNAIAAYEQATGNTVQNESATADDVWTGSVLADFEVGSDPDVVQFWTLTPGNPLVEGKKVVSIDEIRAVYPEYASNISDGALAGSASPVDGKTYAIPTNGYWEGTFYNKALLAQVGYDSFPENWTDFIALCDALKAAGITPIAESLQGEPNYTFEFLMANQVGSALPSSTPKELGDEASKHITKVLEHFKNFYDSGYYPANTTTLNRAEAVQLVADGKAAMMFGGHWNRGGLDTATAEDGTVTTQAATDNIELFGFPTEDPAIRSANTFVGGYSSGFMITRKAWDDPAKRKACVDFVMSVTSDENITNYSGASASPLKVPGKLPEADSTPLLERCRAVIAGGENIFPALEDTWTAPAREGFLYSDIALYCAGTLTADQVIQNLITANAAS